MTCLRFLKSCCFTLALLSATLLGAAVPDQAYSALHWRLVGPLRAGWSTCAEGIAGEPDTYYFGAADGGVWKTTNAGRTWVSLFDHQPVASVGALALAPGHPSVLYVGTGQVAPRWDIAAGNGIYRSRDGGKNWKHVGLEESRHVGRILVDPRDPKVVLVAALGHLFGPNPQRGVFRSTDGGDTWKKVLYRDENTGAVDLASDPSAPDTVYAALWQARRYPWQAYFTPMAGPGSGIYKSTDGGRTWSELSGHGLPGGDMGRIGLAVAPGSDGQRVYAVLTSTDGSGLYRSDNGGSSWRHVNADAGLGNWYFARLTVDPKDPDTVYVTGRSLQRSRDGGKTFTITKGSPGGDDYHFLWINPRDSRYMILGSDQGTTITLNGGRNWSSWYNQPTGQFYHVATDHRFPYWVYSGQQDSGTVGVASRSDYGQLTFRDWHPVGGDERDYDIPDPSDPQVVYGSGLGGRLSRWDGRTGQVQNVAPWPVSSYGARPTTVRYRYTWITPMAVAPEPPHALYLGSQVLFQSLDGGKSWKTISPDLSGAVQGAQGCQGNVKIEDATACGFGVIFTIAPSPRDPAQIWIGTDNGRIQLTRDGGKNWHEVTPNGLSDWSKVAQIDASASDAATAYAAVDRHRLDDYGPHAYRTHDYGNTWTEIIQGLPPDAYLNVVRQDPVQPRLLFAGTSRGVFVSFDDGDQWQSLQMNLPTSGVNDLTINGSDLVAATQGRAIWSLDEFSPLRGLASGSWQGEAYLFPPQPAYRLRGNENRDTPLPPDEPTAANPPEGAVIDYELAGPAADPVSLEVLDSSGQVVRRFRSDQQPNRPAATQYFTDEWLQPLKPLPAHAGHNRLVWNLRYPRPPAIRYQYSIAAVPGADTPALPQGAMVLPGRYAVRLTVGGKTYSRPLRVLMDPRVKTSEANLKAQLDFEKAVTRTLEEVTSTYHQVDSVLKQLADLKRKVQGRAGSADLNSAADRLAEGARRLHSGSAPENLAAIGGVLASLETDLEGADQAPTGPQKEVLKTYAERLKRALDEWTKLKGGALSNLNRLLQEAGRPVIKLP